jgi:ATP-dependent RNA helicase DeaD
MSETNESGQASDHTDTSVQTPSTSDSGQSDASTEEKTESPPPAEASADAEEPENDEAEAEVLPQTFAELGLKGPLLGAVGKMGWEKPTPVQAKCFGPMTEGKDVLVQSHTGSGKTGAFCLPWLDTRFEVGDAADTGVQMLVLLPTRELAKQVCGELQKLAADSEPVVLPVYGGTAIVPQLDALKKGVHAVVGTPGRILDHIRRRSLDLSKVRSVVLDECDEMLSMGFLEDIRAILDTCQRDRQTCLFSATVPGDIARIAKRYMRDPVRIELSGDQVAAAEIDHAYYQASSSIKTRDLLDLIMVEDPTRAIVFCNTREETKLVASVLQREGFSSEMLSSDLTQAQRERVMKAMREHKLRFLVATDVAARGIDISHVSHVINYSFPESPDVYVHRTGRTGRAGRLGLAISLIGSTEIGNFYLLKKLHSSIEFEERQLPPAEELNAQRMEVKLDKISGLFPELVSPEWTVLGRTLMKDPRGERVIAYLLSDAMSKTASQTGPRRELDAETEEEAEERLETRRPRRDGRRGERGDDRRRRGGRNRGRRDEGDRQRRPAEAQDAQAPESAEEVVADKPAEADRAPAEAAPSSAQAEAPEPTVAPDEAEAPATEAPAAEERQESDEGASDDEQAASADDDEQPKRKRRRRRRRRRKGGDDATGDEAGAEEAQASEGEPPAETEAATETDEAADPGDGGRKRKRRRRRRRKGAGGEQAPPPAPKLSQDSIVIDIDESELEVVRTEFGDIDELGDLTVKGRRRAVMDELSDEVVIEDLSEKDAALRAKAEAEEEGEEEDAEEGEEADETAESGEHEQVEAEQAPPAGVPSDAEAKDGDQAASDKPEAATEGDQAEGEAPKKKRRRRRRKKKAAPPPPELTAPPHKDFWEVWASKYTWKDFERDADTVPEEEPPRAQPRDSAAEEVDEGEFIRVELNLGRAHGKKSAAVRNLLASRCGLRGKSVRDLTVRDKTTLFRIPVSRFEHVQSRITGHEVADIILHLSQVGEQNTTPLRVDAPAASEDAPAAEEAAASGDAKTVEDEGVADGTPSPDKETPEAEEESAASAPDPVPTP